ncbi:MAG: hypothetical protein QXL38_01430 [Candidatus Bathyarchaeia archaeon]
MKFFHSNPELDKLFIKPFQAFSRILQNITIKSLGDFHRFLADHAAISVIEEKGEGFENGKPEIGRFWSAFNLVPQITS